ncbi:MAG: hypothetical protein LBB74_01200 [Chitinispirillales bacterium]|jgi:hypothetical protein|nr:hypothetical protein [Chitinispirillales bacterium]
MKEAIGAYRRVSATDEFLAVERLRERTRFNEVSALAHERRKGQKEGISVGLTQTARAMKTDGVPAETIQKYTGLDIDEILRL